MRHLKWINKLTVCVLFSVNGAVSEGETMEHDCQLTTSHNGHTMENSLAHSMNTLPHSTTQNVLTKEAFERKMRLHKEHHWHSSQWQSVAVLLEGYTHPHDAVHT